MTCRQNLTGSVNHRATTERFRASARSGSGAKPLLRQTICGDVVLRVFGNIDFHQVSGVAQEFAALRTQMSQMQSLAAAFVPFGQPVDGFQSGHVANACFAEVEDDVLDVGP